jgi:hypothetical protein
MADDLLTPTELARIFGMERREVIEKCMAWGIPLTRSRISMALFRQSFADAELCETVATWALMDSSGNLIDSFDDRDDANRAFQAILKADPENVAHVILIGFNAEGDPISPPPARERSRVS